MNEFFLLSLSPLGGFKNLQHCVFLRTQTQTFCFGEYWDYLYTLLFKKLTSISLFLSPSLSVCFFAHFLLFWPDTLIERFIETGAFLCKDADMKNYPFMARMIPTNFWLTLFWSPSLLPKGLWSWKIFISTDFTEDLENRHIKVQKMTLSYSQNRHLFLKWFVDFLKIKGD